MFYVVFNVLIFSIVIYLLTVSFKEFKKPKFGELSSILRNSEGFYKRSIDNNFYFTLEKKGFVIEVTVYLNNVSVEKKELNGLVESHNRLFLEGPWASDVYKTIKSDYKDLISNRDGSLISM